VAAQLHRVSACDILLLVERRREIATVGTPSVGI